MRISDWSSDVCSSDLFLRHVAQAFDTILNQHYEYPRALSEASAAAESWVHSGAQWVNSRSEEHTSELQSLMRISYAVFCLKKKNIKTRNIKNSYLSYTNHNNSTSVSTKLQQTYSYTT